MKKGKPIAILDQWNENGKKITYMTAFFGKQWRYDDGRMPKSYAVFKIYLKDNRNWLQKLIRPGSNWASTHLISNQIYK